MRLAPIILFVYRRIPKKTVDSLLENNLSKKSEIFIFSDGYKNNIDKADVLKTRKYLHNIKGFKNINIYESNKNKGLANSIIDGVTKVINEYGKVIILEDDLIVSSDFLNYMNEALEFYEDNEKIWSISGYSPKLKCLKNYKKDIYLSVRANSWGWATWKDRWDTIDWEIRDWNKFKKDKEAIKRFNLGGNDMFKMLELQMLGKIDSWAIRWCYNQFKQDRYTIYPKYSKVFNGGFDKKGTHNTRNSFKWDVKISNHLIKFVDVKIDKEILQSFKDFYDISFYTKIGFFLRKYGFYNFVKRILK